MQGANDKKLKAMYAPLEEDVELKEMEYTDAFKAELDSRYDYYKKGGKMITAAEADKQVSKILIPGKGK